MKICSCIHVAICENKCIDESWVAKLAYISGWVDTVATLSGGLSTQKYSMFIQTAAFGGRQVYYRSVPLIRPPFCTLHPAQSGEGFEYAISLDYVPP